MKNLKVLWWQSVLLVCLGLQACNDPHAPDFIKTNGPTQTATRTLPYLPKELRVQDGLAIELVLGLRSLELTGPANVLPSITLSYPSLGVLALDDGNTFKWLRAYKTVKVRVPADSLIQIKHRGYGALTCADTLRQKQLAFSITGAADVTFWAVCDVFSLDLNGLGRVTLAGRTRYAYVATRLYGTLQADLFSTQLADLEQDGQGDARINVLDSIHIMQKGPGCAVLGVQKGLRIGASKGTCIRYF
jgi:hypothetical protein